jgi:hypothetical protein
MAPPTAPALRTTRPPVSQGWAAIQSQSPIPVAAPPAGTPLEMMSLAAFGWMTDRVREIGEGSRLAWRAVELGKDDAVALARGGHALGFLVGDLNSGVAFVDRALLLNPNLAVACVLSGLLRFYRGETDVAIEHLARAMRLSPLDPTLYQMLDGTGFAHLLAGRFDEASSWAEKAFREEPNYLPAAAVTAASHALAGRLDEARQAMARFRQIDPALYMSNLKDWFPVRRPEHRHMGRRPAESAAARMSDHLSANVKVFGCRAGLHAISDSAELGGAFSKMSEAHVGAVLISGTLWSFFDSIDAKRTSAGHSDAG